MEEEGKIELETLHSLASRDSSIADVDNDSSGSGRIMDEEPAELHKMPELTASKLPPLSLSKILYRLSCAKCSISRIGVLLPFLVFNVGLIFFDVASDLQTGIDLLSKGHHYWGGATLSLQVQQFVCNVVSTCIKWNSDGKYYI